MTSWLVPLLKDADRAFTVALRVTGDAALAEEAVQEASLRILRAAPPEPPAELRLAYWLRAVHSTAVNLCKASAARRRREEEFSMVSRPSREAPDEAAASAELARAARLALFALPVEERQAVSLCCEQGLTRREAAEVLNLPERTVTDIVNRGLDGLRRALVAAGYAAAAPAALASALAGMKLPAAPASLLFRLEQLAADGAPSQAKSGSNGAAQGGLIVKIGMAVAAAGLVAGAAFWAVGGPSSPSEVAGGLRRTGKSGEPAAQPAAPAASAPEAPKTGHKDFEYTTLGDTFFVEWACFTGVVEWLDGPGREGMGRQMGGSSIQGCLRGMQSDDAGNLYMVDMTGGALRVLRKRDRMLLTVSGNGHMTAGRAPEKEGPAYALNLDQMVYVAAIGDPLDGKGSLYVTPENRVVRLFRNEAKGGLWWYEVLAGGGKTTITGPQECNALDVNLRDPRVITAKDGRVGVTRVVGGGSDQRQILYWLKDGKLTPAYDEAAVKAAAGGNFSCYGLDGAGNFAGAGGGGVITVAADGKTVKHKVKVPFGIPWGVYPDHRREWWFVKGMDHYTITRVTPDGKTATLALDGSWMDGQKGKDYLGWMWCLPLQNGRMVGWNSHGCLPLFVGTWLEGK